jgi:lysophospholipase L1-like esterase
MLRTFHFTRSLLVVATVLTSLTCVAQESFGSTTPPKTAVFIGDSYSEGQGAGAASKRFTTLTAQSMGWTEINMASGGTGYLAECWVNGKLHPNYLAVLKSITIQPDIVIVSGGRNDQWNTKTSAAIPVFFSTLRAKFPNAQLIVTSPLWDARRQPPAKMNLIKSAVRVSASANGATYIDLHEPLTGHYEYLTKDWVHPNARGHAAIASALTAQLRNPVPR